MSVLMVLAVTAVLIVGYVVITYNSFQTIRTRIRASIQEIGNQLKRQAGLIPNLEASVKGYLKHEKTIFKQLTDARRAVAAATKSGSLDQADKAVSQLSKLVPALQIAVEDNPELKADKTVTRLMDELRDTADKVMYARRTLIDLTADFNRMLVTVPSNVVGKIFGMKPEKGIETPTTGAHLTVAAEETKAPKVKLE